MRELGFGLGLGRGGRNGAPPRIAGSNLGYAIGDSRSLAVGSPAGGYNLRYPLTVARQLLAGQLNLPFPNVQAVGGYTIAQVQANLFPAALASAASVLILLAGVNDQGSNVAANVDRMAAMAEAWVASDPGRVIVMLDEAPWGGTIGDEAGHQALRDGIRQLHRPAAGVQVVQSWRAVTGGDDGIVALADSYRDSVAPFVHFTIPGSVRIGRALAATLAGVLPPHDFHGQPTTLANSFVAGTLAANDMASFKSLSGGSISESFVSFEGQTWLQIALSNALGYATYYRSGSTIPGDWVLGTTLFESNIDFVLQAGHTNIRMIAFGANKQSGAGMPHYATGTSGVFDGNHSGGSSDAADLSLPDGAEMRGTFWSPRYRLAADATQLKPWFWQISSRTSLPMNGTLLLRRPQCRVVS